MASIARKNLLEDIPRFLVAQAGIMFAVSLVTIQTGLQSGFARSSSLAIDRSQADIWVSSTNMEHVGLSLPIPYDRVTQARKVAGVDRAEAVNVRGSLWRQEDTDRIATITIIGAEPEGLLFSPTNIAANITQGSFKDLKQDYSVIVDETSLDGLGVKQIGDTGKVNFLLPAKLVGLTQKTQSIVFGNTIFTSLENSNAYVNYGATTASSTDNKSSQSQKPQQPSSTQDDLFTSLSEQELSIPLPEKLSSKDYISFVLIRAKPGQNIEALKQRLEAALLDTRAYTRAEMAERTQTYWQKRSGIGFILGLGAVVGVIVGVVIVGQILYSSVSDHIKEFGTLKAMGASDWFIYSVIIEQALWMAILGYIPGTALCLGVAAWTSASQGIMILITPGSAIAVLGVTVVMCVVSAVFAIQKVTRVDPAIVFKS